MRTPLALGLAVVLAGCGGGISGDYGGEDCGFFDRLSFRGDGVVDVTMMGTQIAGTYTEDGDRVVVSVEGEPGLVFTRDGSTLQSSIAGETFTCTEL